MLEQQDSNVIDVEERPLVMTIAERRCSAPTKSGKSCQAKAGSSGFCAAHDPAKIAERDQQRRLQEEAQKAYREKTQALRQIIEHIETICKAKGWSCRTQHFDQETGIYATLQASLEIDLGVEVAVSIDLEHRKDGTHMSLLQSPFSVSDTARIKQLQQALVRDLETLLGKPLSQSSNVDLAERTGKKDALQRVEIILKNFHRAAKQLEVRHDGRSSIIIEDEYDVQDILHSFLHTSFEDIRAEDYAPLRAGGRSRVDFLLFEEKIVIEAKMTRSDLKDKGIGEQLSIDIQRYQGHADCQTLVCFVYDPGGFLRNPKSLRNDLNGKHGKINVEVIIYHP